MAFVDKIFAIDRRISKMKSDLDVLDKQIEAVEKVLIDIPAYSYPIEVGVLKGNLTIENKKLMFSYTESSWNRPKGIYLGLCPMITKKACADKFEDFLDHYITQLDLYFKECTL